MLEHGLVHKVCGDIQANGTWEDAFIRKAACDNAHATGTLGTGERNATHRKECKMGKLCPKILVLIGHLLVAAEEQSPPGGRGGNFCWLHVQGKLWTGDLWLARPLDKIIWDNLKLCWLRWGSFGIPECIYLSDQSKEILDLPKTMKKKINWYFESSNIKQTEWYRILNGFWGFFPFPYLLYLWTIRGADSSHLVLRLQLQSHLLSCQWKSAPLKSVIQGPLSFPILLSTLVFYFFWLCLSISVP